ncbi:MAG TPA: ribonuclease P protein subunit, partial [Methanomassiliicoccaceae archaeon]|nr:ribonuclease P protein subunit [Methanomassiliicoccaceae archaeon]
MRSELIGLEVEVRSSGQGVFTGTVVDETKNTFTIRREGREVMVP